MLKDAVGGFIAAFRFETWPVGPGKPANTVGGTVAKFIPPGKKFAAATPVLPLTVNRLVVPVP